MALAAEYYMVEHGAVRELLATRQKQIDQMAHYMTLMGSSAALIGGFTTSLWSGMAAGVSDAVVDWEDWWFDQALWVQLLAIFSCISLGASIHCILFSMYIVMWAYRLSLTGPTGSVARAIAAMHHLGPHIRWSFIVMLAFFGLSMVASFFIVTALDKIMTWVVSVTFIIMFIGTNVLLRDVYTRFKIDEEDKKYSNKGALAVRMSLEQRDSDVTGYASILGGGKKGDASKGNFSSKNANDTGVDVLGGIAENADFFGEDKDGKLKQKKEKEKSNVDLEMKAVSSSGSTPKCEGLLEKKGNGWQARWFVLQGHEFVYYTSEEAYQNGDPPCKNTVFSLDGYEVMVMDDAQFSFTLKPVTGSGAERKRNWELRAKTENDRVKWVRAFLAATMSFDGTLREDTHLEPESVPKRKSRWGTSFGSFIGSGKSQSRSGESQASEQEMAQETKSPIV